MATRRNEGIDAFQFLMCFFVALLHTLPGITGRPAGMWDVVAASACRGAVPFFFIASGYFMHVPDRVKWEIVAKPAIRIIPVYLFWLAIYAVTFGGGGFKGIASILTGGPAFHLWFLPALCLSLTLLPVCLLALGNRATAAATIGLAVVGLLFGAYRTPLHLPEIPATRLAMAPLQVLVGYWLARNPIKLRASTLIGLCAACWAGEVAEEWSIARLADVPIVSHEAAFSIALGAAIFLLARQLPGSGLARLLAELGRVSLGIYAAHLLFIVLAWRWMARDGLWRSWEVAVLATGAATALSLSMSRFRALRRFVS